MLYSAYIKLKRGSLVKIPNSLRNYVVTKEDHKGEFTAVPVSGCGLPAIIDERTYVIYDVVRQ